MTAWRSFKEKQLVASREGVLGTVPAWEEAPSGVVPSNVQALAIINNARRAIIQSASHYVDTSMEMS